MFEFQLTSKINERVWKVKHKEQDYVLKYYASNTNLEKVRMIHHQLEAIHFPYVLPIENKISTNYLVQKWLGNAQSFRYNYAFDRTKSLQLLQALHETSEQIHWPEQPLLQELPIIQKWQHRLWRFEQLKELVCQYIDVEDYLKIVHYATIALTKIQNMQLPTEKPTLLHGDVVHHNFLKTEEKAYMIDFDLAHLGASSLEKVLWMHRVLPTVNYELKELIEEQPYLQNLDRQYYLFLLYPNELLREWLHFLTRLQKPSDSYLNKLLDFTTSALFKWPYLWYNIEQIKN